MIVIPSLQLAYQFVPKVGTTSLFSYFYACMYGIPYEPQRHIHNGQPTFVHRYFIGGDCPEVQDVSNSQAAAGDYGGYYRFALTRDPVRRFLSMYANRVIQKSELSPRSPFAGAIKQAGLPFDPDINLMVRHLDAYLSCHSSMWHHARPMMDLLGPDLSVYTRIADLAAMDSVVDEIKGHWRSTGLAAQADCAPVLPRMQRCGCRLGLECLNAESFQKLVDFYRVDYLNLPTVSVSAIHDAYDKARKGSVGASDDQVAVAPAMVASAHHHGRIAPHG